MSLALLVGSAAGAATLLALVAGASPAPAAWLFAWFFWLGLPLGALAILALHRLTGGRWGLALRPVLVAALRTLPWLLLLALPLLWFADRLYPWLIHPEGNQAAWYLNYTFFLARIAVYFALWLFFSWRLPIAGPRMAAGAAVAHALLVTLAAVDLVMSLQPEWFSTVFGLLVGVAQILSVLAFCAVALRWFAPGGSAQDHHDLGNLLLAFVMTWAYLAFTQFLIIWYENLPREIVWYLPRVQGVWAFIALAIVLFHFALPFLLLLLRGTKRQLPRLAALGVVLLLARMADTYWLVVPSVRVSPSWLDAAALLGIGGWWIGAFLFHLDRAAEPSHG